MPRIPSPTGDAASADSGTDAVTTKYDDDYDLHVW